MKEVLSLFKNQLFVKILLIFTLPALGILYFSSLLVYEKIDTLSDISNIQKNIKYIKNVKNLLDSISKEREYSTIFYKNSDYEKKMMKQRVITDQTYEIYLNDIKNDYSFFNSSYINEKTDNFISLRKQIDNKKITPFEIVDKYSDINDNLLQSLHRIKPIKYALKFNVKFNHIVNILNANEQVNLEKLLITLFILENKISKDDYKKLIKIYMKEDIYTKHYLTKFNTKDLERYNEIVSLSLTKKIEDIKNNLNELISSKKLTLNSWWELSDKKIEQLQKFYNYINKNAITLAKQKQDDATTSQIISLTFLFVCFVTLISLLFVLRTIIFNQQKNFNKLTKQQSIYKVLSKLNKVILKIKSRKKLFQKLIKIITKDSYICLGMIYTVKQSHSKLFLINGNLKDEVSLVEQDNSLIKKAIVNKKNIIKNSNLLHYCNIKDEDIKKNNIKSMGIFPIYKFNKVVSLIVLYSKKQNFFDNEVIILFNKVLLDVEYALEKIDYEKNKAKQEQQLTIAAYAFESNEPMLITNNQAKVINVNQAFCNVMGYKREDIIGQNPSIFKSDEHSPEFYEIMWESIIKKGTWSGEIYNKKKNNELIPLKATITAIKDKDNNIKHYLSQYNDISEQKLKQQYLEYQATHDSLTTLPNRLLLLDRIEHVLSKVARYKTYAGIIFIDLDNFKTINDTMGHETGDILLKAVSKKLQETVRSEDTISRIGGDEFIVLADSLGLDKASARNNIQILASKIKGALNDIKTINGYKNISTPSIGITLFNDNTFNVKELIKQADNAMYMAKRAGKNTISFFE
ncbi:diguanylate cyclase [Malaciobacter molluscorum LMG 25693]|uniref:Diguanylate cyclase n=1 Tax=Malaciobacter molluscorum LMG 25693 TaxID=870501 RepID=A0A2G1DJL4_9BACT|nr:diguanylate cyclase [Malaciobacter molluscorum LMG 25693]